MPRKKLTQDKVNVMLDQLVDEGHLIPHGGLPERGYSRARMPSGAPYPEEAYVEATSRHGPNPVDADAARAPFNKNFTARR
ncbi:MAG TPA: hypothetical protein VHQ48_07085 [Bradyrhizobium sp.]|jgi:hypothetical protein|nr:hypothetical protein [Bradyrhizobium sp.]